MVTKIRLGWLLVFMMASVSLTANEKSRFSLEEKRPGLFVASELPKEHPAKIASHCNDSRSAGCGSEATSCGKCGECECRCDRMAMPNKNVTPSARGCYDRDGFYTFADFLYWTSNEKAGLKLTLYNIDIDQFNRAVSIPLGNSWDPGVRAGIGGNLPYDGWDINGYWTYFKNKTSRSYSGTSDAGFLGLVGIWLFTAPTNVTQTDGHYELRYNAADVELGRAFYVSSALSLRPFVSGEAIWLDRYFLVNVAAENAGISAPDAPGYYRATVDYWGAGPRAGMNSKWYFCKGFNISSNLSFSYLYGKYTESMKTLQTQSGTPDGRLTRFKDYGTWISVPHLQLFLGVGWEKCFGCNRYFFNIEAGWEDNEFWDLPGFSVPSAYSESVFPIAGKVSTQGLTARVRFDF